MLLSSGAPPDGRPLGRGRVLGRHPPTGPAWSRSADRALPPGRRLHAGLTRARSTRGERCQHRLVSTANPGSSAGRTSSATETTCRPTRKRRGQGKPGRPARQDAGAAAQPALQARCL